MTSWPPARRANQATPHPEREWEDGQDSNLRRYLVAEVEAPSRCPPSTTRPPSQYIHQKRLHLLRSAPPDTVRGGARSRTRRAGAIRGEYPPTRFARMGRMMHPGVTGGL